MLPVVDKPLIQSRSKRPPRRGSRHIFITGRNKRAIEDHFDKAYELETEAVAAQQDGALSRCRRSRRPASTALHPPDEALGLGMAVLCAEPSS